MEFLYPIFALAGLSIIPLIIIHKLIQKDKINIFPSNFLWEEVINEQKASRNINKLRRSLPFYLQIIIILLTVLILMEPRLKISKNKLQNIAIVIDTSYSMNIKNGDDTRLEMAKKDILNNLNGLENGQELSLYEFGQELIKIESGKLGEGSFRKKIRDMKGTDFSRSELKTIEKISQLGSDKDIDGILFYSDQKYIDLPEKVKLVSLGQRFFDNTAIENVKVDSKTLVVEIKNYSNSNVKKEVKLVLDQEKSYVADIELAPEERIFKTFDIKENFDYGTVSLDGQDSFDKDNKYYFIRPNLEKISVLWLGNENRFLEKALSIQKNIEIIKSKDESISSGYNMYIYSGINPIKYPEKGSMLIFENDGKQNIDVGRNYEFSKSSILEYMDSSFDIMRAKVFENKENILPLIYSGKSIIAYGTKTGKSSILRFGFDLYDTDLMLKKEFPILIKNSIEWLIGDSNIGKNEFGVGDYYENDIVLDKPGIYDESDSNINKTIAVNLDYAEKKSGETYKLGSEDIFSYKKDLKLQESYRNFRDFLIIILAVLLIFEWGVYRYDR